MGSRREAFIAGHIPKKMPTRLEKPSPSAKDHHGSDTGKPANTLTPYPIALPSTTPRMPPIDVSTTASMRNWTRISRRRAPSALRTPISRVRSVTEMVMMAITPMPPTISAIDEITTSASRMARVNWLRMPRIESAVSRSKSFSSSSRSRWRLRRISSTSRISCSREYPSRGDTRIWMNRSR